MQVVSCSLRELMEEKKIIAKTFLKIICLYSSLYKQSIIAISFATSLAILNVIMAVLNDNTSF